MSNATELLESLDAAEIRQRLEAIDKERQALLVLHRAAIRFERQGGTQRTRQPATAPATAGGNGR
jgi:hypothetical protein